MFKIPHKIEPDTISEAIFDIRFDTNVNRDAVFGLLVKALSIEFDAFEDLPILEIPKKLRESQEELRLQPYYNTVKENLSLSIGPQVINLNCKKDYIGWVQFKESIFWVVGALLEARIVSQFNRVALRYINEFEVNIFENINLKVDFDLEKEINPSKLLKFSTYDNPVHNNVIINSIERAGEIYGQVDIDSIIYDIDYLNTKNNFNNNFINVIEKIHSTETELYFRILNEKYLKENFKVYYD